MKPQTFEEALQDLVKINQKLNEDKLPLDEAMKLYEEGIKLTAICEEKLNVAEKKIEILTAEKNKQPFEVE